MRERQAFARADEERAAALLASEINALPERVRRYIHDLETNADPAGDKWRILALEETVIGLQAEIKRLTSVAQSVHCANSNDDNTKGECND